MKKWAVTFEVTIEYEKKVMPTESDINKYKQCLHEDIDRAEIEWIQTEETK